MAWEREDGPAVLPPSRGRLDISATRCWCCHLSLATYSIRHPLVSGMTFTVTLGGILYGCQFQSRQWVVGRWYRLRRRTGVGRESTTGQVPLTPHRVLLVITGLLGDTVMSTP